MSVFPALPWNAPMALLHRRAVGRLATFALQLLRAAPR